MGDVVVARKSKWGPVVVQKSNTRNHVKVNIMAKAEAYKRKKNLEIPPTFKSKSFPSNSFNDLDEHACAVDIKMGDNQVENHDIICDVIVVENIAGVDFTSQNQEISLPASIDL